MTTPLLDRDTLENLMKRIMEKAVMEGECLVSHHNRQIAHGKQYYSVTKVVWQYHHKGEIQENHIYQPICGNKNCIQNDHLHFGSKANPSDKEEIKQMMLENSTPSADGECRILDCGSTPYGYGLWTVKGTRYLLQRVVVWLNGDWEKITDLPENMVAAHGCRNLKCITPEHYELVTRRINNYDHRIRDGTLTNKFSEENAKAIIALWKPKDDKEYMRTTERAKLFGVSSQYVSKIDTRVIWSYLPHPNGRPIPTKKQNSSVDQLTTEDLTELENRLRELSSLALENNKFTNTPCWLWNTKTKQEKPKMRFKGVLKQAHIFACQVSSGPKPFEKAHARHLCGQGGCVNPSHICWGTAKENTADKRAHGTSSNQLNIVEARKIRAATGTQAEIAVKFGVSRQTVGNVQRGTRWKE